MWLIILTPGTVTSVATTLGSNVNKGKGSLTMLYVDPSEYGTIFSMLVFIFHGSKNSVTVIVDCIIFLLGNTPSSKKLALMTIFSLS